VVTLGPEAAEALAELIGTAPPRIAGEITIGDVNTHAISMSHPYGDFNFDEARLKYDADVLSQAWSGSDRIRLSRQP
jgi:hypothetical protein